MGVHMSKEGCSDHASEPSSPKRQKRENDGEEEEEEDSPKYSKEDERLMEEMIRKSEGFDIDFEKSRARLRFLPVELDDHFFCKEPETDEVLLENLSRKALDKYNQEKGTELKVSKVVKANWHPCEGVMFFITFEVIDPSSDDSQPIPYQAKVHHFSDIFTEIVFCRPKPSQQD